MGVMRPSSWRCQISSPGRGLPRIVRNLKRGKRRPPRPTRGWTKSTGPSELSLMRMAIAAISGAVTITAKAARPKLKARCKNRRVLDLLSFVQKIRLLGCMFSMASFRATSS